MYRNSDARRKVLALLKERGPSTIEDLASELGTVPVTVRSHLNALAAQGLVSTTDERGRVGRPRRRYSLTSEADSLYPNRYAAFAGELLDSLQAVAGQRGVDQLLDLAAARQAAALARSTHGRGLDERVPRVAEVLRAESGFADWTEEGDLFVLRETHCPYGELARARPDVCRYHTQVVTRLLGEPATLEASIARGDRACRFTVRRRPSPHPTGVRRLSDGRVAPE